MTTLDMTLDLYQNAEGLVNHNLSSKEGSIPKSNERKINQQIKSCVCANRFYENIGDQKTAVSEYLDKRFGRWIDGDLCYDT
jgi:hypothetical protein